MRVYVWRRVSRCSDNYHREGGVVVFARSEERAREIANENEGCRIKEDEVPDEIRDVCGGEEMVFLFPDAGCC